jgi:hypothetical protein
MRDKETYHLQGSDTYFWKCIMKYEIKRMEESSIVAIPDDQIFCHYVTVPKLLCLK